MLLSQAGTVWVNRHCEFIRNAPFGGVDSSGIGRAGDLGDQERRFQVVLAATSFAAPGPESIHRDPAPLSFTRG